MTDVEVFLDWQQPKSRHRQSSRHCGATVQNRIEAAIKQGATYYVGKFAERGVAVNRRVGRVHIFSLCVAVGVAHENIAP